MKRYGKPEVVVTGKLRSYGAAMKEIGNADRLESRRQLNNRAGDSHFPLDDRIGQCRALDKCEVCEIRFH
ncbi:MAG: hypothetical protein CVT79_09740 [Alphaproteobacteria bacterium HGW-Alphaproteobacteria-18]|nr:MAG: hypothetical protein CVT79_09740 [Alphaproteobacteria bacterium HGW-Alphaproteobacteria-18]